MGLHILILGGTTEARTLAGALAEGRHAVVLSLAGRTRAPMAQPVPTRIGGFGGAEGLARTLRDEGFDLLIDATHPFAARISENAAIASRATGIPAFALRRPPWERRPGDLWTCVDSVKTAVAALGTAPRRVLLAIGRQEAAVFEAAPQHTYLVRSVDPVDPPLMLPDVRYILATGPFGEADEQALLIEHRIDSIVAKNSGGSATYGKIAAARALGIAVILVERAAGHALPAVGTVEEALARIDHVSAPERKRGV
ncbi:cobalt-precorrin-6X reductase [Rhizobium sp. Leaf384]|uniref:cobalt-precorrin-6A reductase n=1 Tax=unclassified Rhizobium TaxID=2613769 RepID=UPI000714ABFD|nr:MULTISPECIES: cobalt-precorrin-6A reductase [unclassified Rhizobium]KQR75987.1 cobalt-precorrin-6X reductase [Rhizobium sp. Leaf341]KQS76598.1 cobalt-precorrin-6X reductase [Rhizobium sp. Leaf383]KQS77867.1 cobalt-precorrin-6X reductase [Rhizobium sp. Leaf384]